MTVWVGLGYADFIPLVEVYPLWLVCLGFVSECLLRYIDRVVQHQVPSSKYTLFEHAHLVGTCEYWIHSRITTHIQSYIYVLVASTLCVVGSIDPTHASALTAYAQGVDGSGTALRSDLSPALLSGDMYTGYGVQETVLVSSMGPLGSDTDLAASYADPDVTDVTTYIVQNGDTVASVASLFKISQNTILWQNDLERGVKLKPGQELIILPVDGLSHTIKKGDTIASIAARYRADADDIRNFNGIDDSQLRIGNQIVVPGGQMPKAVVIPPAVTKAGQKVTARVTGSRELVVGGYLHPLNGAGRKTQGYHDRWQAVDIGAPTGTPIYASMDGTVAIANRAGWGGGYGLYVLLKHNNGSQTMYAHMSRVAVTPGQTVQQGEVIGYVGSTGRSTGPHIHFEIRYGMRILW